MPTASTTAPLSRVNDFVVRFANVNGSGSASANEMFARAVDVREANDEVVYAAERRGCCGGRHFDPA